MADVVMPRLSDSMEEGTILQWMKQVGDEVAVGDELVEIETDKANMAYESDLAGTLTEILAQEGATLPIGEPIARIGDSAEGSGASAAGPDTGADRSAAGPVTDEAAAEGPAAQGNAPAESRGRPAGTIRRWAGNLRWRGGWWAAEGLAARTAHGEGRRHRT